MAIQTVTNDNLAEYAAERTNRTEIRTGEDVIAAVTKDTPILATGEEKSPDAPPEPQADQQPERKGEKRDVQARINELTRLRKEAEEFAEDEYNSRLRAERRIGELESQLKQIEGSARVAEPPKQDELKEPNEADFKDITSFTKAWSEYTLKLAEKKAAEAREQERQRLALEVENERLKQRVDAAKADLEDFEEVISRGARDRQIPVHIERAIRESEYGPHLAYHLAKNPDDESRIFGMTPAKALLELGKIQDTYERKATVKVTSTTEAALKPTVETTRAPAPVSSIKAEAGAVPTSSSQARSFVEYRQLRMAEMRKNRR